VFICFSDQKIPKSVKIYVSHSHSHAYNIVFLGMFAWFAAAMATDALGLASINPIAASSLIGFGTPPPDVDINFSIVDFHGIEDDTIPYNESTSSGN
jgi:hypothetical protein